MAAINKNCEIFAECELNQLSFLLWDIAFLVNRISIEGMSWERLNLRPKFSEYVRDLITDLVGKDRIISKPQIKGFSGRLIEFPFAVKAKNFSHQYLVQTIPVTERGLVNWGVAHQSFAKFSDEKYTENRASLNETVFN